MDELITLANLPIHVLLIIVVLFLYREQRKCKSDYVDHLEHEHGIREVDKLSTSE